MFIERGLVFLTSNDGMTVNNEMRKTVKKATLEYFDLMFRRSASGEYEVYSEPRP